MLIAILAVLILASMITNKGNIQVSIENSLLTVTDPEEQEYIIAFSDIQSINLQSEIEYGTCIDGKDTDKYKYGTWENNIWDKYSLCVNSRADKYIVVNSQDTVLVFNYNTDYDTNDFYSAFQELLDLK